MANSFASGHTIDLLVTPSGSAQVELGVKSHNLDYTALLFDVTNTKHGGGTARLAGKFDVAGTVTAALDHDEKPWDQPFLIYPGVGGLMVFGLGFGVGITVPWICEKLHWEAAVDSEVRWSFDVKMDVTKGSLTLP